MTQLDPLSMTVLAKAVDFLFDQGARIVQDLMRHKDKPVENPPTVDGPEIGKNDVLEAMSSKINVLEIQHCMDQIEAYLKNVHAYERQAAIHGGEVVAPLDIVNKLEISRDELRKAILKLKQLLENSSQKKINILGLE